MSKAKTFIRKFKDIKTLPHVVTNLSRLIADDNSTMKDFEKVIRMDPILVVRLLRLVNSPFYGLVHRVDSIGRAVAYLGMKNLHNIAVTDALKNIFQEQGQSQAFSRKKLWLHCAAVSICSKMIAERIFGTNGDDAYLCGILHDFGLIVESQVEPKKFLAACEVCNEGVSLIHLEREYLGTDHCEIGFLMTQDWDMPENIQEAIRDHHLENGDYPPESLTGILQIAEYITGQLGHTALVGITSALPEHLVVHLQENMDEYKVLIEDLPEEMSNAQDLYGE
ncbi:MAG TPA: HDOD domain-containing protein [Desulfobacterales bacterium]|nr:HDOD domain-containing protein [Desulfobacterales bacterium]HIP39270.1 HDOD domain-containing protein [Desulfocapsa sulfexigens]